MSPNLTLISLISLALTGMINPALADDATIALHGNDRGTPACMSCHGAHGEGMPANGFPRLAGQNADYLQAQLVALTNGQRFNAMMTPIAKTLNADERATVARYYAGLGSPAGINAAVPETNSVGARLAIQGRWPQGLPACIQCHGAMGVGVGSTFPALAGQSSIYIENQLRAWQQGTRAPGPLGLMKVIASKLSATDIHDVATYFSALPTSTVSTRNQP
ncbi:c-type cytochrome [Sulfuriferula nivalis]|uniref:Cytochrome c n=1 Tax=Sulfuriferula nivalis TaxID=2675298 RepID=A0A809S9K3_9PROT|nr:c-type cytochrome [Sulfuriferula nivalis]BBP01323.1 cytochrome c [Sulfuriferula nivalis]